MKIVHICTTFSGGAGLCASRIMAATRALGIETYGLTLDGTKSQYVDVVEKNNLFSWMGMKRRIQTFLFGLIISQKSNENAYKKRRRGCFERFIENHFLPVTNYSVEKHPWISEADIIHLHWTGGFLDYDSFFENVQKPIVWTLHDENAGLGIFNYHPIDGAVGTERQHQVDYSWLIKKKKAYGYIREMYTVAISSMMKGFIEHNELLSEFPCTLIHNGVDENMFYPKDRNVARKELGIEENRLVFLFVAQNIHEPRKGLSYLIRALDTLHLPNTMLSCVGNYEFHPHASFEIRCERFTKEPEHLSIFYSAADFFLMPSFQEAFAQTPLEAMACGTPVIAFPHSGASDLIRPFNGIVCRDFTLDALVCGIKEALSTQYDRNKIRQDIIERFSYRVIGKQYEKLYNSILKCKDKEHLGEKKLCPCVTVKER